MSVVRNTAWGKYSVVSPGEVPSEGAVAQLQGSVMFLPCNFDHAFRAVPQDRFSRGPGVLGRLDQVAFPAWRIRERIRFGYATFPTARPSVMTFYAALSSLTSRLAPPRADGQPPPTGPI